MLKADEGKYIETLTPLSLGFPEPGPTLVDYLNVSEKQRFNDPTIDVLVDQITSLHNLARTDKKMTFLPFIIVDGSSGVGKTQLAVTLSTYNNKFKFLFIHGSFRMGDEHRQAIYSDLATRYQSLYFKDIIEKSHQLRVLCKLFEIQTKPFPSPLDVRVQIKQQDQPYVVVVDEISEVLQSHREEFIQFRSDLREAGFILILMGTNSIAMNTPTSASDSRTDASFPYHWCSVLHKFPEFNDHGLINLVRQGPWFEVVKDHSKVSRPWITNLMIAAIQKNNLAFDAEGFGQMMAEIGAAVTEKKAQGQPYKEKGFCVGQLACLQAHYSNIKKSAPVVTSHFFNLNLPEYKGPEFPLVPVCRINGSSVAIPTSLQMHKAQMTQFSSGMLSAYFELSEWVLWMTLTTPSMMGALVPINPNVH